MDSEVLESWATDFFSERVELVEKVLPFPASADVLLNTDEDRVSAVIRSDLADEGSAVDDAAEESCRNSDLYSIKVEYRAGVDRVKKFPAILVSSFQLLAAGKPAIRFEYERDKKHVPAAHVHVHGVAGLLSPGLMRNGKKGVRNGWLDTQCAAAVRDTPEVAAEALRELGYTVSPPEKSVEHPGRHSGW